MSRIYEAFKTVRSIERGEPQPTALNKFAHEHSLNIQKYIAELEAKVAELKPYAHELCSFTSSVEEYDTTINELDQIDIKHFKGIVKLQREEVAELEAMLAKAKELLSDIRPSIRYISDISETAEKQLKEIDEFLNDNT